MEGGREGELRERRERVGSRNERGRERRKRRWIED